ncbi:probable E3 ubiquitin-protein ligase RHY1A isoform X2 [Punica granatum]|uniref:Probable E3 ubiquitin-protein ligase RHY1A isoform X2 n=1 Tax=Punica granatum TaxID=22663 RepID=A0A6P8D4W3_PUNGR|nr:probable E3 ubiquitin-protein ligase RHY1A isoform X2 [Punica granatum]
MAGMLPGVELARRRRLPRGGSWVEPPATSAYSSTRRASLCLYARNHDGRSSSSSSSSGHEDGDEKLGGVAREAKERLDERLRSRGRKSSDLRRETSTEMVAGRSGQHDDHRPQRELFGLNRSASKRFMSWANLISWKGVDQEECAVCLERFMSGETLMNLPCNHKFHSGCLVPWLETNSRCPCCRTTVPSS